MYLWCFFSFSGLTQFAEPAHQDPKRHQVRHFHMVPFPRYDGQRVDGARPVLGVVPGAGGRRGSGVGQAGGRHQQAEEQRRPPSLRHVCWKTSDSFQPLRSALSFLLTFDFSPNIQTLFLREHGGPFSGVLPAGIGFSTAGEAQPILMLHLLRPRLTRTG